MLLNNRLSWQHLIKVSREINISSDALDNLTKLFDKYPTSGYNMPKFLNQHHNTCNAVYS